MTTKKKTVREEIKEQPTVPEAATADQEPRYIPEKDLFTWTAPARPFKRRNRKFWTTVLVMVGIFGFILLLIEGVMPVLLIISVIFLFYILTTVEPGNIDYKITNKGIRIAERLNPWPDLFRFWFTIRFDTKLLVLQTFGLTGRLELVINKGDEDKIRKVLKPYVAEEEAPPSQIDKMANWLSSKLPGNV